MSRIDDLKTYKKNRAMLEKLKQRQRDDEADMLVDQIRALKPRIDELLATANACVKNGIEINAYGKSHDHVRDSYENGTFVTNGISRQIGFVDDRSITDLGPPQFTMIGINNNGSYGDGVHDFRTNGKAVYFVASYDFRKRKQGPSYQIEDLKKFLNGFDAFESAFYAYVDKVIERQRASLDDVIQSAETKKREQPQNQGHDRADDRNDI